MNAQPQLRSNSAKAPQRWVPISESDDETRTEEQKKQCEKNREHCTMCLKDKPGLVLLDCGHRYCNCCLDHHIRLMLRMEDFPPRCCGQAISVYKYSDVLSHVVLGKYLQARTRKACQGSIRCAGSECTDKRSRISRYLIEDEWGLCGKCHQVTCARCCRLRTHHKGGGEARICPTAIKLTGTNPTTSDLTTTQSTTVGLTTEDLPSKEVPREVEARKCSKCNEVISHTDGQNTMPCPCGAVICLKCAGVHRKTQSFIPFGCWCRAMAQPQPQPRSAISGKASGVLHPPTSAPNTSAAPGNVRAGVGSNQKKMRPIAPRPQQQLPQQQFFQRHPMQQQQEVHQRQIQGLSNLHFWVQEIKPGQCNRCHRSEQIIAQCNKCGRKSCWMCSRSSCGGRPTTLQMPQNDNRGLITSASFPTPDRIRHALNGKENGLTRNQISQALFCPVEFLNKVLGQMLNADLIWVLNTDDETRYGLRRTPRKYANDASASASDVVYYGMLHQNSYPQRDIRRHPSDQNSEDSESQASTALDTLAKVCHDHLEEGGLPRH